MGRYFEDKIILWILHCEHFLIRVATCKSTLSNVIVYYNLIIFIQIIDVGNRLRKLKSPSLIILSNLIIIHQKNQQLFLNLGSKAKKIIIDLIDNTVILFRH